MSDVTQGAAVTADERHAAMALGATRPHHARALRALQERVLRR